MFSFSYLEPVCCSMFCSNCSFLTCIQVSQEAGQVVWYSHLFQNFPQFIVIYTVKGFGIVNKAEINVFLELSCFFDDPVDGGSLISGSSAFSKTSLNIWKFTVHVLLIRKMQIFCLIYTDIVAIKVNVFWKMIKFHLSSSPPFPYFTIQSWWISVPCILLYFYHLRQFSQFSRSVLSYSYVYINYTYCGNLTNHPPNVHSLVPSMDGLNLNVILYGKKEIL